MRRIMPVIGSNTGIKIYRAYASLFPQVKINLTPTLAIQTLDRGKIGIVVNALVGTRQRIPASPALNVCLEALV
jgi:hypothetical protein